jgi:hypothetical protein
LLKNHTNQTETARFFLLNPAKSPKTVNSLIYNILKRLGQINVSSFWRAYSMGKILFVVSDVPTPVGMILFSVSGVPMAWARHCSAFLMSPR